jgi:quinol monooxygenase YgiN
VIVINGTISVDPSRRDDLVAAAIAMQRASQAEPSCHHYVFSADLEHSDVFHIAEKWEDQAGLDAHFSTPHMAAFGQAIAGAVVSMDVTKYLVASEEKMR